MKRLTLVLAATFAVAAFAQTSEPVDAAAFAKIRDEGLNRSQVMDTMFWLTDRYGPRLIGSPEFEEAGDWAVKQLQSWGVANVHKERFAFGNGWSLVNFHATMTVAARDADHRRAEVVDAGHRRHGHRRRRAAGDRERGGLQKYRGQLKGKIVLTQPAREVRMLEYGDGTVLRYADKNAKWAGKR